jgi:hypothetical protein
MTGDPAAADAPDRVPDDAAADDVPDHVLFTALDFAVGIAAAGAQLRPPMPFPGGLRPFLRVQKLSPKSMTAVRRAIECDPVFRQRLGAVAVPELLDEAGMLWLQRPEGWVERLTALVPEPDELDIATQLRRSEKRREAAEQVARRALAEVAALRAEHDRRTDSAATAAHETAKLRDELAAARTEGAARDRRVRRLTDQLAAASARVAELESLLVDAEARVVDAEQVRDRALDSRAAGRAPSELERAATVPPRPARRGRGATQRRPIALPGGVYGSSDEAAEFLVRHAGVVVLVDGYNVAKLGWPALDLTEQREQCIRACENISRRYGTEVVAVFDGASITGASAAQRRLVRVRFSPEGITADDVIRDEVASLATGVPVVVATNDQEIVGDVRSMGANVLTSEQLLALGRR